MIIRKFASSATLPFFTTALKPRLTFSKLSSGPLVREGYEKVVGNWLIGCSGLLTGMVLIGGYTRLSGSGLSMVDWNLSGNWLPIGQTAWEAEFERYKEFPEYKKVYAPRNMNLQEFKRIYFVEWFHRQFGRFTGLFFTVPLLGLTTAGIIKSRLFARLAGLAGLGLAQGLVGWWMVKSGLHDDLLTRPEQPRVSPYRMAFHWSMALALFGSTLWTGLAVRSAAPVVAAAAADSTATAAVNALIRRAMHPALAFAGLTLASGPFVAGNDAGLAFNRWPLMTETSMIPDEVKDLAKNIWKSVSLWNPAVSFGTATSPGTSTQTKEQQKPLWRHCFEETGVVQFLHRTVAYGTVASSLGLGYYAAVRLGGAIAKGSPLYWATRAVPALAVAQMTLGIATLLMYVPTDLALAHQAGGLAVFTSLLWLRFLVRN